MSELLIIAVVALLFLGPDKLPEAAKSLSRGIRDLRKQSRELQDTLEGDHEFGSAIKDLKSALRGDELPSIHERQRQAAEKARELQAARLKASAGILGPGSTAPSDTPDQAGAADQAGADQAQQDFHASILGEWAAPEQVPPTEPVNPHVDEPDKIGKHPVGMPSIRPASYAVPTNASLDMPDDSPDSPASAATTATATDEADSGAREPVATSSTAGAAGTSVNERLDRNHG